MPNSSYTQPQSTAARDFRRAVAVLREAERRRRRVTEKRQLYTAFLKRVLRPDE